MLFTIKNRLKFSIIAMGISSIVTQIIILRESLSVFYGNELVMGIILAIWMFLTGIGSYLGKFSYKIKNKTLSIISLQVLLAVLPIITVLLMSYLRNVIFPVGSMISVMDILYISLILLLPYCILDGFLFTLFCNDIYDRYKDNQISKVYSYEAIGSIIGGVIFNFILVYLLKTFQSLMFLMIIYLSAAFFLSLKVKTKTTKYAVLFLSIIFLFITFHFNLDNISKKFLFTNQTILYQKDTPYGNIVVTQTGEQKNFFENGVSLFSTNNVTVNEESVHYAMIQHPNPKNILLISGDFSGTTNEILKYDVNKIDYVEINPFLIDVAKKYSTGLENPKIHIINKDARLFVKETSNLYDVILINLPEPTTAQINRFYTINFFKELKKKLNNNAVISISLQSTLNYISDEARETNSVLYSTLKRAFKNVLIIPGGKNYYLASDGKLNINIAKMIENKHIDNVYVNQYYIDDNLLKERSNYILNNLNKNSAINKDFMPVSYYKQLLYWLSYFKSNYWIFIIGLIALIVFLVSKLNIVNLGLFTGGFSSSSIEVLLLISFQIIYGYVYQMTGIIITLFMAGLAVGSLYLYKVIGKINIKNYIKIQLALGIYSIILPFVLLLLNKMAVNAIIVHTIFFLLTLIIAVLIGIEFAFASKIQREKISTVAAESYSADLLGGAIGALTVSAFLIPLLGIIKVCFIIALLNFISATIIFIKRKKSIIL